MKAIICELVLTSGTPCERQAKYQITDNNRRDPDTTPHYVCAEHLVDMLGTTVGFPKCTEWTVSEIN